MSLKLLFIGGTGNISLPCVAEAAAAGHRVSVFNRGTTSVDLPQSVTTIAGDLGDTAYRELGRAGFDVVCQFITFTPEQMTLRLSPAGPASSSSSRQPRSTRSHRSAM
jgi:putative NADH-flavin reductase